MLGVLAVRPEGALLFFNADHVRDRVLQLVAESAPTPQTVLLVLVAVPHLNLVGSGLVIELRATLAKQGIALQIAEARDAVCDALKRAGGERTIDFSTAKLTAAEAIAALGSGAGLMARHS